VLADRGLGLSSRSSAAGKDQVRAVDAEVWLLLQWFAMHIA
jgi:hypothetical protein